MQDDKAAEKLFAALDAEVNFMKKKHGDLPQGRILKYQEYSQQLLDGIERTKQVVRNLVGSEPKPTDLTEWINKRVFDPEKYNPKAYNVPQHPDYNNVSEDERAKYTKKMKSLAEIAGFAALSHPSVVGNPLLEGFNENETTQLQYTMILNNMITSGRENCDYYMQFMDNARAKAKTALEAYHTGELGPMAELIGNAVRKTNREAACITSVTSTPHAVHTLYLTDRLWTVLKDDEKLLEATGLNQEEIEEAQANAELYQVMKKGIESKKALLEYALHQRKMTPEQVKEAGADILFAYQLEEAIRTENNDYSNVKNANPAYQAAMAKIQTDPDTAQREMNLLELQKPGYVVLKDLLKNNWVKDAKAALVAESNLNRLLDMSREDLGTMISSKTSFTNAFLKSRAHSANGNAPEKEKIIQHEVSQSQVQQQKLN